MFLFTLQSLNVTKNRVMLRHLEPYTNYTIHIQALVEGSPHVGNITSIQGRTLEAGKFSFSFEFKIQLQIICMYIYKYINACTGKILIKMNRYIYFTLPICGSQKTLFWGVGGGANSCSSRTSIAIDHSCTDHGSDMCKISKWFDNWAISCGQTMFRQIWV